MRAIEEFTEKNGRRPTHNEVAVLVRETRADKLTEISTEEVRRRQKARLSRATKDVGRNEALEVVRVNEQKIVARNGRGRNGIGGG